MKNKKNFRRHHTNLSFDDWLQFLRHSQQKIRHFDLPAILKFYRRYLFYNSCIISKKIQQLFLLKNCHF
jgi:hypothetical protein